MIEPDPFYDQALEELGAFSSRLYAQSSPLSGAAAAEDEIAPLFRELSRIRDRYEQPELIACGGMKEIYRTYDRRATRHVALAKPVAALGEDSYDAFLREAHITARLDHPGIVKLFDMGIDEDGRPFFTMELKKGRSLRDVLRGARSGSEFPMHRRLEILLRVCEAVSYAHSRRVLHLDLKPENIQVGEFGEVHVCDWGMGVVIRQEADEVKRTEALLDPDLYGPLLMHTRGTRGYMAPEQFKAGQAKSFAMDVYALGCMLQELVTLHSPDGGEATSEIADDALRSIFRKARHASPEKRYRSVGAFSKDLSRYLTGYSTSAEGAGFFREMKLFYRRNRIPCRLVAGLFLLIISLTAVFIGQLRSSREKAVDARLAAERTQALYHEEKIRAQAALDSYIAERDESSRRLLGQSELAALSVTELTNPSFLVDGSILPKTVANAMKHLDAAIALSPPTGVPHLASKILADVPDSGLRRCTGHSGEGYGRCGRFVSPG
jgi:serine/threonine protein kinase